MESPESLQLIQRGVGWSVWFQRATVVLLMLLLLAVAMLALRLCLSTSVTPRSAIPTPSKRPDPSETVLPSTSDGPAGVEIPSSPLEANGERCDATSTVRVDAPRGLEVVSFDGVTVAYSPGWMSTEEARMLACDAAATLESAADLLGTHRREELLVVTYGRPLEMYRRFNNYMLTSCGFDEAAHVLVTRGGAVVTSSLRHAVMHAQLRSVAPCAPFWFDEGLAEHFESPTIPVFDWLRLIRLQTWIPFETLSEPVYDEEPNVLIEEELLITGQCHAMVAMLLAKDPQKVREGIALSRSGVPRHRLWDSLLPNNGGEALLGFAERRLSLNLTPGERAGLAETCFVCRRERHGVLPRCERSDCRLCPSCPDAPSVRARCPCDIRLLQPTGASDEPHCVYRFWGNRTGVGGMSDEECELLSETLERS